MKDKLLPALVSVLLCADCLVAQTRPPGEPEPGYTKRTLENYTPAKRWVKRDYGHGFWRLAKMSGDYHLGPGDQVRVEIFGAEELSGMLQAATIDSSGELQVPLIGAVRAAGLTAEGLEEQVVSELKAAGFIAQPEVLVTVIDCAAKPVFVIGEVDNPGEYIMRQSWTLSEALLIAGGIDLGAARYGYLHRRHAADVSPVAPPPDILGAPEVPLPSREVLKVDLQPLKTGMTLNPDPLLRAGDVFIVPTSNEKRAYVIGAVAGPGAVTLRADERLPLSQALSAVGGPTRTASSEGLVVRMGQAGPQSVKFDFKAILAGTQPDQLLQPDDIVFVPGSGAKTVSAALEAMIPAFLRTAAWVAIW